MLVSAVLSLFALMLGLVLAPLPTATLGTFSGTLSTAITNGSGILGFMNTFLPITEMVYCLGLVLIGWLPAVVIYKTVNWIYRHIPMIGGG